MLDFPEVPLLCKEGLGEVEAWRKHVGLHPALVAISTTLPHLNPPLTKGRTLVGRHFGNNLGTNTHAKPGSASFFPFVLSENFFEVLNILVHHREEIPLVRNIASGVKHHAVDSQRLQSVNSL